MYGRSPFNDITHQQYLWCHIQVWVFIFPCELLYDTTYHLISYLNIIPMKLSVPSFIVITKNTLIFPPLHCGTLYTLVDMGQSPLHMLAVFPVRWGLCKILQGTSYFWFIPQKNCFSNYLLFILDGSKKSAVDAMVSEVNCSFTNTDYNL